MPLGIDIQTLVIVIGITHLMQVLIFVYLYQVNKAYQGPGWWLLWSACEVIGFSAILFRQNPSWLPLVIIVQNSMIISGTIFLYVGLRRFIGKTANLKLVVPIISLFGVGMFYFLFLDNEVHVRSGLISVTLACISFITAQTLFATTIKSIQTATRFTGSVFVVHGALLLFFAFINVIGGRSNDLLYSTLVNQVLYFDVLIVSLLSTFGMIIMLSQRLHEDLVEAKTNMQLIFNTSPDATIITRLDDGRIIDMNEGYVAITGYSRTEMAEKSTLDINIWKDTEDRQKVVTLLREHGFCDNYEAQFIRRDKSEITGLMSAKVINLNGVPHIISISKDISEIKKTEHKILKANRIYAVISQINQSIVRLKSDNEVFREVCRIAVEYGKFRMAWIGMVNPLLLVVEPVAFSGTEDGYLSKIKRISITDTPEGQGPTGNALRAGNHVICNNIRNDPGMAPWREEALSRGYESSIALPIKRFGLVIGSFNIYASAPFFFDQVETNLLIEITNDIGFALEVSEMEGKRKQAEEQIQHLNDNLEQRVEERTSQLVAANKEIDAFAYTVSHDLRAPLRGINGFTQILLEDYAGKLDDEGRRLCEVIRGNSTKMGQLIDDLLAFSRLHRVEMQYSPVDMKEMVNSLYMEMTDTVSRNRINLTVAELSTVTADPAMISQVWQNLLSNAIKYSSRKENAEIAITSKQEHGKIIYCISDNGAGFDMQYIHKIFGVFQRLHSEKQYEGTGVGLAIVQRIVERHGGNVWAEGEPGNGATFYFSLPVAGAAG